MEVLIPTIRTSGSEIWLSLNSDQPATQRTSALSRHCRNVVLLTESLAEHVICTAGTKQPPKLIS
jgi:hypothetical protein